MKKSRDINEVVESWVAPPVPDGKILNGRYAKLEPLTAAVHGAELFRENLASDAIWDFLPYGPFLAEDDYQEWIAEVTASTDPFFYAIWDKTSKKWSGVASYLRISPNVGTIEVGHINFSPALQKSVAATEAMFLMMKWAYEAGYRRYEWKCNAKNIGSRRAAERLGFSYEGIFRKAGIVKGRNRDTAWFASIDNEWPALNAAFLNWLSPDNFGQDGMQKTRLSELTAPIRVANDPDLAT